jgi:transcriptional regulator with XRE-family HTH domain
MAPNQNVVDRQNFAQSLAATRTLRSLSQKELASLCALSQVQISYFERGKRWPSLPQLIKLAEVLEVPLERLLADRYQSIPLGGAPYQLIPLGGAPYQVLQGPLERLLPHRDRPEVDLGELAFELRNLGLVDLKVGNTHVPGAFRPPEQVVSLAVVGDEPEPRVIEAIPALLAWNSWSVHLLKAYARTYQVLGRIAWLADVALTLNKTQGFPGGVLHSRQLARFLRLAKPSATPDNLGRPAGDAALSPVWKRWNITYAGKLADFQERATHLYTLRKERRFWGLQVKPSRVNPSRFLGRGDSSR